MTAALASPTIPGVSYLFGNLHADGGHVKVLWLEDKVSLVVPLQFKRFIHLTHVKVPESAERMLEATRSDPQSYMRGAEYKLTGCPHDVYIADHRLDEAPTNEVGPPTFARQAEAAGLTTSVVMALNFPFHPATIAPYTAYEDQIKYQRDLLRRLSPHHINVIWENELGKLEKGTVEVLTEALISHRNFLTVAATTGSVHLRSQERERVRKELDTCLAARKSWPDGRQIILETRWGARPILLGALWPETIGEDDEAPLTIDRHAQISQWLDAFPIPSAEEKLAAELALHYFQLRTTVESQMRYEFADLVRDGADPGGNTDDGRRMRELCDAMQLDTRKVAAFVQAVTQKEPVPELEIPSGLKHPHLFAAASEKKLPSSTKRLAVLFLFVYEEAMRAALRELLESGQEHIGEGRRAGAPFDLAAAAALHTDLETLSRGESVEPARRKANKQLLKCLQESDRAAELWNLFARLQPTWQLTQPLTKRYVPRLLDPLPEKALTADADIKPSYIGRQLMRSGFEDLSELLSPGNEGQISLIERLALQRFARDLGFQEFEWPRWMR